MRFTSVFTVIILFINCSPKIETEQSKLWNLKRLESSIKLPNEFKPISVEKYIEKLKKIPNSSNSGSNFQLEQVKKESMKYQLFYDTTSFVNNILLLELEEHIMIDKATATGYVSMLEQDLYQSYLQGGIEYNRLELKYYGKIDLQMITIRYKITKDEMSKYISQFIVSTKNKTIGVTTQNLSNINFRKVVNTLKIK